MLNARIVIIGGGLSGLYAAHLLDKNGIRDYVLLEGRDRFGGRLLSPGGSQYDLGATWFWPDMQPELADVVRQLGLTTFAQYDSGDMLIDGAAGSATRRVRGYVSAPASLRIRGGMGEFIKALGGRLAEHQYHLRHRVRALSLEGEHIRIEASNQRGELVSCQTQYVYLAIPPRLASSLVFSPALPTELHHQWQRCDTWMAPHAKYLAVYDRPFWRAQGLSGSAQSAAGPMVEIHDASPEQGEGALFGFIGVPAQARRRLSDEALRFHCRTQLERLFGPDAAHPKQEFLKDWSTDPFTAVNADAFGRGEHPAAVSSIVSSGAWQNRLVGIASEWSPRFPGYVAGAIDATDRGVTRFVRQQSLQALPPISAYTEVKND